MYRDSGVITHGVVGGKGAEEGTGVRSPALDAGTGGKALRGISKVGVK